MHLLFYQVEYIILLDRQNVIVTGYILPMWMDPRRAGFNTFAGRTLPTTGLDQTTLS